MSFFSPSYRGQAVLSTVFLIGGIIILVGLGLAVLASSFINSTYGFQAALRAQAVASSGIHDGLMQLVRNKDFADVVGYTVPLGADSAAVTVTQNAPATGEATIYSTATVSQRRRAIKVVVSIDSTYGRVTVVSWQQA